MFLFVILLSYVTEIQFLECFLDDIVEFMFQFFTLLFFLRLSLLVVIKVMIILNFLSYVFEETLIRLFIFDFSVNFFLLSQHVHHQLIIVRKREKDLDIIWPISKRTQKKLLAIVRLDCIVHSWNVRLDLHWVTRATLQVSRLIWVCILTLEIGIHHY